MGILIRGSRVEKGLSLRELARQLDRAPSYLSDIENDRRVPAEELLGQIARLLDLDFDDLMALGGRFGEVMERYVKRRPMAGVLYRRIAEKNLPEDKLRDILDSISKPGKRGRKD